MKKSLSILLSAALAFGTFASVASAADANLTTQQKFDELKAKGIFAGMADGSAGLDQKLQRSQAARIVALLLGAEGIGNPDTKVVTEKPFSDVELGKWYTEEIAAVKELKAMSGNTDGTFNPNGNLTNQEVAALLGQVLKLEPVADAKVDGAADWAAGYIKALEAKGFAVPTPYTADATRGALVDATYFANGILNPDKVSIASAKAAGVFKVEVQLNREVDTSKATLTLKKGSLTVSTTPKWSDDKKSATLTLDSRITAGDYTVTLGGLDAESVGTATASFTAQDETVSKIEYVSATDTLPYSKYAAIEVRAENQYGEATSLGASNFTALVSGQTVTMKKNESGNFYFTANVSGTAGITQGNGVIPVTVYMNNSGITATKNFKVGTVPLLSKIETGNVTYSNATTSKLTNVGDTATIALKLYDQYGNPIVKNQFIPYTTSATPPVTVTEINVSNINPVITPYEQNLVVVKTGVGGALDVADLFDDNDNPVLKVKLNAKLDKNADYTVNIYGGSSSATAKVTVGAAKLATKIEFDTSSVVLAANDKDVVIPVIAYDANGDKLSAQDLADNAAITPARFNFTATNAVSAAIVRTGSDKGKLKVTFNTPINGIYNSVNSQIYVSGQINQSLTNTFVQTNLVVGDARVPDHIAISDDIAPKAILGAGETLDFQLKDQYNKDRGNLSVANIASANGQTSQYQVVVDVVKTGSGVNAVPNSLPRTAVSHPTPGTDRYVFQYDELDKFNDKWNLTSTANQEGKVVVKATIQKNPNSAGFSDFSSTVSRSFEAIKTNTDLTYSLDTIGSLFAAQDKFNGNAGVTGNGTNQANDSLSPDYVRTPTPVLPSQFAKKLKVIAKDASGTEVKLPENYVYSVSSSDPTVIDFGVDKVTTPSPIDDGYVIGNKAGTATVTAVVYTNKGNTVYLTQDVTVKADTIVVDSIKADNTSKSFNSTDWGNLDNGTTFAYSLFNSLIVKDQYGIEYKDAVVSKYQSVLGIRFTVQTTSGTGAVSIDPITGLINSIAPGVNEFEITALAPNGKSVTFVVAKDI